MPLKKEQELALHCVNHMGEKPYYEQIVKLLIKEGLSNKVVNLCLQNGLRRFVVTPTSLVPSMNTLTTISTENATEVVNYLNPETTSCCFHVVQQLKEGSSISYLSLHLNQMPSHPHKATDFCKQVSFSQAKKIACSNLLQSNAFGIVLNEFAVREVVTLGDNSTIAYCYGQSRQFMLKERTIG
jgi:hypothetical protein